jgi:Beta protein
MLGSGDHYVPILKSKAAEISALKHLTPLEKGRLTPLIEILPETVSNEKKLKALATNISSSFGRNDPFFFDVSLIEAKKAVLDQIKSAGLKAIPVVSQSESDAYYKLIQPFERACLRVNVSRTLGDQSAEAIPALLEKSSKKPAEVDLVADFGPIQQRSAPRTSELAKVLFGRLPFLDRWRSVFVSATSFPTDLRSIRKDTAVTVPREEWRMFLQLRLLMKDIVISFSDYAIQHPVQAKVDPKIMQISTQLRITQKNDWLLIRGQSTKTAGYPYIRNVCKKALQDADPQPDSSFCWGDKFIVECAAGQRGTGSAGTWRQAGFSRHFAIVLSQLVDL